MFFSCFSAQFNKSNALLSFLGGRGQPTRGVTMIFRSFFFHFFLFLTILIRLWLQQKDLELLDRRLSERIEDDVTDGFRDVLKNDVVNDYDVDVKEKVYTFL